MNAKNEKGDPTRSEATRSSATRSTRFEVDVEAPAEHVWKAFTEAEELVRWFPLQAEVTPGEGGSVLWAWGGAWDWRHRVDAWEAPRLLRLVQDLPQRFDADGKPITDTSAGAPMAIEVTLTSSGGTTRVTLVHSGFGEGAAWCCVARPRASAVARRVTTKVRQRGSGTRRDLRLRESGWLEMRGRTGVALRRVPTG